MVGDIKSREKVLSGGKIFDGSVGLSESDFLSLQLSDIFETSSRRWSELEP